MQPDGLKLAFDRDNLSAFVKAAARADAVGLLGFAALFAALHLGQGEYAVGSDALAAAAS